jgi:hypothetical protein
MSSPAERLPEYIWCPQPGPQFMAYAAVAIPELLFGGAKYGGKSDFLLGDYLQDVQEYQKHWQGILIRQSMPELDEMIRRSGELYPRTGAEWKEQKKEWHWSNGAVLRMRALERAEDFFKYNGHSFTWIGEDEVGQWPNGRGHKMLKGCLRWAEADIPYKRMRASANPGGVGHQWVRNWWQIDRYPGGMHLIWDDATKMHRVFIPSRVKDNQIGLRNDPGYIDRLKGTGDASLVKAWLEGDWNVILGSFYPEFRTAGEFCHVVDPFEIPDHWPRLLGFDWGSAKPFSVGWWAVSDGEQLERMPFIPRGGLVCYREWYGSTGEPDEGLRMRTEEVAAGIRQRTAKGEKFADLVADPSIFKVDGGESVAETLARNGVRFRRADNSRINGWQQLRDRLIGLDGRPMIYWFSTCVDSIRTIPSMQRDIHKAEDVDTDCEDHCGDQTRYVCMARPWVRKKVGESKPRYGIHEIRMEELFNPRKLVHHRRARI